MMPLKNALLACAALCSSGAGAVEFTQVQADKTSVAFMYQQMGVKMDGRFRKFSAQLAFDPARPTAASVSFDIDLASVDTGSAEGDQEVATRPWFDTRSFPTARFASNGVKALGGGRYEVSGKLAIKGRSQDMVIPATFAAQGNTAVFDGAFSIRRGDFAIGEGAWAKFDIVSNDVQVRFRVTASGK